MSLSSNASVTRSVVFLVLVFICLFLTGCSTFGTYNPAIGKKELIFISTSEEVDLGKSFHKSIVEREGPVLSNSQSIRVREIGSKVADVSDRKDYTYHFYVLDKDDMNAFTSLGGNIYIYSGLVNKLETDANIAAVLAHEIGHCAAKHVVKKFQASMGFDLLRNVIFSALELEGGVKEIASLSSGTVMNLVSSAYSRSDEYMADKLSVRYLKNAGYDMNAMVDALTILKQEAKGNHGLLILRSHPFLDDRIIEVGKEIKSLKK